MKLGNTKAVKVFRYLTATKIKKKAEKAREKALRAINVATLASTKFVMAW